jgi:hypothetical protein
MVNENYKFSLICMMCFKAAKIAAKMILSSNLHNAVPDQERLRYEWLINLSEILLADYVCILSMPSALYRGSFQMLFIFSRISTKELNKTIKAKINFQPEKKSFLNQTLEI